MTGYFVWGSRKGKSFQHLYKTKSEAIRARARAQALGYEAHFRRADRPVPKLKKRKRRKR